MTYFLQVVVLSAHAQTLLSIGSATWLWVTCSQYNILPLVHTCIGEHQCRVVFNHHRGRGHDSVLFLLEKLLKRFANLVS